MRSRFVSLTSRVRNGAATSLIPVLVAIALPAAANGAPAGTTFIVETSKTDTNADGIVDQEVTTTTELDPRGRIQFSSTIGRNVVDDSILFFQQTRNEYNHLGLIVLTISEGGSGEMVTNRRFVEFEYDAKKNLLRTAEQTDSDGDGIIDITSITTNTATSRPTVTVSTHTDDFDGDGIIDQSSTITTSFDKRGNRIRERNEKDTDADGIVDTVIDVARTFTNRGSLLTQTTLVTEGGVTNSDSTEIDYDKRGLLARYTQSSEPDGNLTTGVVCRDVRGNMILYLEKVDLGGDGVIDEEQTMTARFDQQGREIENVSTSISFNDPNQNFKSTGSFEYDVRGNIVRSVTDIESEADAIKRYRYEYLFVFDERGRRLTSTYTTDDEIDGVSDFIQTETNTYSRDGKRTSITSEIDFDADGVVDYRSVFTRITN